MHVQVHVYVLNVGFSSSTILQLNWYSKKHFFYLLQSYYDAPGVALFYLSN